MALPTTFSRLGSQLSTRFGSRSIHTSYCYLVEQDWRYKNGLSRNPNAYGALTDNKDFSFLDGRPTPLGVGQLRRIETNKAHAQKIVQIVKEMDFAVERHSKLQKQKEDHKKEILDNKLKPKGHLLLSKSK